MASVIVVRGSVGGLGHMFGMVVSVCQRQAQVSSRNLLSKQFFRCLSSDYISRSLVNQQFMKCISTSDISKSPVNHKFYRYLCTGHDDHGDKPALPKKPLGSYMAFSVDKRDEIKQENPGLSMQEIAKLTGQMWKDLPIEEKEVYIATAKHDLEEYQKKKEMVLAQLTPDELKAWQEETEKRRKARANIRRKKLLKDLGKPKQGAISGFACYVKAMDLERGEAPITQYLRGLAEHWKKMPLQDKEPYTKEAEQNRQEYQDAMVKWEERMREEGRISLIRGYKKTTKKKKKRRAKKAKAKKTKAAKSSRKKTTKMAEEKTDPNPQWMREE